MSAEGEKANVELLLKSLSPEQLHTITRLLSQDDVAVATRRSYYLVRHEGFETIVDGRDAETPEQAAEAASGPLQRWYRVAPLNLNTNYNVECITHDQYCDWLRRGVE
jgi:hypothetical protein